MTPIAPPIADPSCCLAWPDESRECSAHPMRGRADAYEMLTHPDEATRLAAIQSFVYEWEFDDSVAEALKALACGDNSPVVRFRAAAVIILVHLRCTIREDRLALEAILETIARAARQLPEVIAEIDGYLQNMSVR